MLLVNASILLYFAFRVYTTYEALAGNYPAADIFVIVLFFLAETFILTRAFGYFINVYRSSSNKPLPSEPVELEKEPSVTILIPTSKESKDILRKTLVAAEFIDYNNKRILIIDGNKNQKTSPAYAISKEFPDVDYFFLPKPRHGAKAGAINDALKYIRSKYIAIFDADYRSGRNFLKRLVPRLESDENITFIQTPQFYGNITDSKVSQAAQIQQTFFYEHISEGKSLSGAMFMCGTNLIIRTKRLREIGGFVENSITEDFATSIKFAEYGYIGAYDNTTTAYGDGPLNIAEHFKQQYRWARGTVGTFISKLPKLLTPGSKITMGQRWEYLLSGTHYFIGIVWIILATLPMVYILLSIPVSIADTRWYILAYFPYFAFSLMMVVTSLNSRQYRNFDWLKSESLTFLTSPIYAKACIDSLLGRKTSFQVTAKDAKPDTMPANFMMYLTLFITFSSFTLIFGIVKLMGDGDTLPLIINMFWLLYHICIALYLPLSIYAKR